MISMPFFRRLAARAAILLAAGTLAACQVDVDQGGGYDPGPRMCTREYAPVCGTRRGEVQTFPNACEARSSGYSIVGRGECRFDGRPDPRPDEGRACTREYAPVCGSRGRDRQTFANSCEARSSGYDVIGRGECQSRRPDTGWQGDRERPRDQVTIGWQDQGRDRGDDRSARERDRDRRNEDRETGKTRERDRERVVNRRQDADIQLGLDGGKTRADRSGREERENPRCADKRLAKRDASCAVN